MTQFSRRARWLNTLFPASKAPQVRDPGVVSDDVSLVQQYDAGGYAFQKTDFFKAFPAQAAGNVDVMETGPDEIIRVLAISAHNIVDPKPRNFLLWISTVGALSSGAWGTYGNGVYYEVGSNIMNNDPTAYTNMPPVLPPSTRIQFSYTTGSVLTEVVVTALFIRAPIGTVFVV